jgi:hypothetical protein
MDDTAKETNGVSDDLCNARSRLDRLFGLTRRLGLNPAPRTTVCGQWWPRQFRFMEHMELSRHVDLDRVGKTEKEIGEEALKILRAFPILASYGNYKNRFGEQLYPLWHFVIAGFDLNVVREVYSMYVEALSIPLQKEDTDAPPTRHHRGYGNGLPAGLGHLRHNYLLNVACQSTADTPDDVLVFLAKHYPAAISARYRDNKFSIANRLLGASNVAQKGHASWKVAHALAPTSSDWCLRFFEDLLRSGYGSDILDPAVDQINACHSDRENHTCKRACSCGNSGWDRLSSSPYQWHNSQMTLGQDQANAIGRLLCPSNCDQIRLQSLSCVPPTWTPDGLLCLLKHLSSSVSVKELGLGLPLTADRDAHELLKTLLEIKSYEELELVGNQKENRNQDNELLLSILIGLSRNAKLALKKLTIRNMFIADISMIGQFLSCVSTPLELILRKTEAEGTWEARGKCQIGSNVTIRLDNCLMTPKLLATTMEIMPRATRPKRIDLAAASQNHAGGTPNVPVIAPWTSWRREQELPSDQHKPVDISRLWPYLFRGGHLEKLFIAGPYRHFRWDMKSLCDALKHDSALHTLQLQFPLDSKEGQSELLELLLKNNTTLEHVQIFDKDKKLDYTGFSQRPRGERLSQRPRGEKLSITHRFTNISGAYIDIGRLVVFDDSFATKINHFTKLNHFGRNKMRDVQTTKAEIIGLLQNARAKLASRGNNDADPLCYLNVIFGLLHDSPNAWISPEALLPQEGTEEL